MKYCYIFLSYRKKKLHHFYRLKYITKGLCVNIFSGYDVFEILKETQYIRLSLIVGNASSNNKFTFLTYPKNYK